MQGSFLLVNVSFWRQLGFPACAGANAHDGVEADAFLHVFPQVSQEVLPVHLHLQRQAESTSPRYAPRTSTLPPADGSIDTQRQKARAAPGSCCTCRLSRQCARARRPWWPGLHTGWGRGRGPRSSPGPHTLWTAARTLLSVAGTGSGAAQQKLWMRSCGWWSSTARSEVLTFSFSVLTSFLSSLFFSLPGASAVGMDEWKMKSLPLHSAAWGRERRAS